MSKDYVDQILDEVKRDLQDHTVPHVRYDKNSKKMSVTYDFNLGRIPRVKIITGRDRWLEWFHDFDRLNFEVIKSKLSRPGKKLNELERYAKEYPNSFIGDLFSCVQYSYFENPLAPHNIKARGIDRYPKLDRYELVTIKLTAGHLYVYLQENRDSLPEGFLEAFGLGESDLENLKFATLCIIEDIFDNFTLDSYENADGIDPSEIFYHKYITYVPLNRLKKIDLIKSGKSPLLQKIFARLKPHKS